jgi:hypothetical protein
VIKNLKPLISVNKKGGCMLKKVFSVLVICSFMLTNVCFAMPSAAQVNAAVDNMALKSFLQTGDIAELNAQREGFTALLNEYTQGTYDQAATQEILDMWAANLQSADVDTRVAAAQKLGLPGITVDANGTVNIDIVAGQSSVATSPANVKKLNDLAAEKIDALEFTAVTDKKADRDALEAMVAGSGREAEILAAFDSKSLNTIAPVVIDANNRLHGMSTADAVYIDENLKGTARTDMILHETLETLNSNIADVEARDEEVMKQQAAIHGGKDGQMAQTKQAMEESAAEVIAQEVAKTPSDKVEISKDFLSKDKNDAAAQEEAMNIAKQAFAGEEDKLAKAKADDLVTMIQGLMTKKIQEITSDLANALTAFVPAAESVTQTNVIQEATTKINNGLKDGEVLAMEYDTLFTTRNGNVVPRAGALTFFDSLNKSKVKDGAVQIISAANVQGAQDALGYLFPDIGNKVVVNAGKESSLDVVKTNPALLRVLYTNESAIDNIADVTYIKSPTMDKVDGLKVVIAALAPNLKSLTESEQAILNDLGNGNFELQNVEIDEAAYQKMEAAYEEVVNILIQA